VAVYLVGEKMSEDLKQRLEQKTAQQGALRKIGQALSSAWDLESTLELITRQTAQVMGMDSCSIYLLDESGETLILKATTGLAPEAIGRARLRLGEGITGWAAQEGVALGVRDAARDPRFKYLPETRELDFKSLLAVPLVSQGRVIGAMNVQTTAFHDYGEDEIELLSLIGDLAAGALEKAELYDNMRRQIAELSTLAEVSRTITSPLYLDEMLGLIVEMAAQIMNAKVCSLMLLDEAKGELMIRATQSLSQDYINKPPLRVGEGIAGLVAQEGVPITVLDVREEPRYHYTEIARQEGLCSLLGVPLRVRERIIGVFNCYTAEPHHFTREEIDLFSTLANQTALAIENANLVMNAAIVREMHHRVKNNLQTVAMLLRLQMSGGREVSAQEVLHESINRILSIASVHEVLSQKGFRLVDVKDVIERIVAAITQNMLQPDKDIQITVEGEEVSLPSQPATSLALAVNELIQNSVEHAFVGRKQGAIAIRLAQDQEHLSIEVTDDGVGFPADYEGRGAAPARSLGLQIVETLVEEDLKGEFVLSNERGTRALIRIPRGQWEVRL
jgi:signal transduction protein with GAF and PtsI domain/anti-sigma regulatory factor (Ser/Thr protein kinase)